jgi:hypothetical protein
MPRARGLDAGLGEQPPSIDFGLHEEKSKADILKQPSASNVRRLPE